MKRFNKKSFEPIDEEENELMESLENEDWETVYHAEQEKEKAMAAARGTLRKNKRINLRLTEKDYHQIQVKAIKEGSFLIIFIYISVNYISQTGAFTTKIFEKTHLL